MEDARAGEGAQRAAFDLPGLSCAACARRAEAVLRRAPGVLAASAWVLRERADVRFDRGRTSARRLARALGRAGFAVGRRAPAASGSPRLAELGVGLAALANLLVLPRVAAPADPVAQAACVILAGLVVAVAGVPTARRAWQDLREGVLAREALATLAIAACFSAGALELSAARRAGTPVLTLPGAEGLQAAALIACAALVARAFERGLRARTVRELFARARRSAELPRPGPRDAVEAELDAAARAALARVDDAAAYPAAGSWDDAASRGLVTAALAFASLALITHGWLGSGGALAPRALLSAGAVLAGASVASVLAALPAARAAAIAHARGAGVAVNDPAALEILAQVDTACFDPDAEPAPLPRTIRSLRDRGVRALALRGGGPGPDPAARVRELQRAGACVVVVGGGQGTADAADVAIELARDPAARAASIVAGAGADLGSLVELARSLRAVVRQNVALAAAFDAALIPAAALGRVGPREAAALALAEGLLGLANAARLLRR